MKKVIFVAVFTNINYVYMLSLLAKSIFLYGNIDDDTDILIYTSSKFKRIIENSSYYSPRRIRFFINNSIDTIDKACKSRLDLFDYKYIDKYDKILYLDTDILVQKNINFIFDLIQENKIYALGEGNIEQDENDYFGGKSLFKNDASKYADKTAFNSGVMLFNNCIEIKNLFRRIQIHMIQDKSAKFNDQPYIVYNAKKYDLVNNTKLNDYIELTNKLPTTTKPILHISGGPGIYRNKLKLMVIYYNYMLKYTTFV